MPLWWWDRGDMGHRVPPPCPPCPPCPTCPPCPPCQPCPTCLSTSPTFIHFYLAEMVQTKYQKEFRLKKSQMATKRSEITKRVCRNFTYFSFVNNTNWRENISKTTFLYNKDHGSYVCQRSGSSKRGSLAFDIGESIMCLLITPRCQIAHQQ